jgi:hypothetical protein
VTASFPAPTIDEPQHMSALRKANTVRIARSKVKRAIYRKPSRESAAAAAAVLMDPPECMRSMPVLELLCAIRRFERTRSRRLLDEAGVLSEQRPLGILTVRQRDALVGALEKAVR